MNYGLPYQGSKNAIAKDICGMLPLAENFYDLFAGGCAITHYCLLHGGYKNIYANDISDIPQLFYDAIKGKYKDEKRWISREDFEKLKDSDIYVSICWSFGNARGGYLYSKEIEPWKKALHYARVYKDFSLLESFGIHTTATNADIVKHKDEFKEKYILWYIKNVLKSTKEYEELKKNLNEKIKHGEEELRAYLCNSLAKSGLKQSEVNKRLNTQMSGHYFGKSQWEFPTREVYAKMQEFMPLDKDYDEIYGLQELLENIQSLESLESLHISQKDYAEVEIKPNSVIYCDIPYEKTAGYKSGEFDHKRFYDWAVNQTEPIFISSYNISDDRFVEIMSFSKVASFSQTNKKAVEKLYVPKHQRKRVPLTLFDLV